VTRYNARSKPSQPVKPTSRCPSGAGPAPEVTRRRPVGGSVLSRITRISMRSTVQQRARIRHRPLGRRPWPSNEQAWPWRDEHGPRRGKTGVRRQPPRCRPGHRHRNGRHRRTIVIFGVLIRVILKFARRRGLRVPGPSRLRRGCASAGQPADRRPGRARRSRWGRPHVHSEVRVQARGDLRPHLADPRRDQDAQALPNRRFPSAVRSGQPDPAGHRLPGGGG
jgi:hypothetical protein